MWLVGLLDKNISNRSHCNAVVMSRADFFPGAKLTYPMLVLFITYIDPMVLSLERGEEAGEGRGLLPLLDGEHQGVVLVPLGRVGGEVVLERVDTM